MDLLETLFLATKEPLEEKEVVSYMEEMGIKEGGIDKESFENRVHTKAIGDVIVYYPTSVHDQKQDKGDEKFLEYLRQHLLLIKSKPTMEEMEARIRERSKRKDELVIDYWAKNNEKLSTQTLEEPNNISSIEHNTKIAQLVHSKINLLHDLNDTKDETHRLCGFLADLNQSTVKEVISRLQPKEE